MEPILDSEINTNDFNNTTFVLKNTNVSIANAVRRTLLSDIPLVVFKTAQPDINSPKLIHFIANTTRLNNELLKQRLNCIPVHMSPEEYPIDRLLLEVNIENNTDSTLICTTEHFKIKDTSTGEYFPKSKLEEIFPPFISNSGQKYYVDFVRLRPKIAEEIPGEKLHFTCKFSIGTAHEDTCFNAVGTCSYECVVDADAKQEALVKKVQEWKNAGISNEDIVLKSKDWKLLDGMRVIKPDCFKYTITSVCLHSNPMLVIIACNVLNNRLAKMSTLLDEDEIPIAPANNTMDNCYDITLINEDYTLGKVLEVMFYTKYFEQMKILTYCGFKKMHPHDDFSIIRLAYKDSIDKASIKINFKSCIEDSVKAFNKIKSIFVDKNA
jgi:DNA-directed RNA polymerase subunit L